MLAAARHSVSRGRRMLQEQRCHRAQRPRVPQSREGEEGQTPRRPQVSIPLLCVQLPPGALGKETVRSDQLGFIS